MVAIYQAIAEEAGNDILSLSRVSAERYPWICMMGRSLQQQCRAWMPRVQLRSKGVDGRIGPHHGPVQDGEQR